MTENAVTTIGDQPGWVTPQSMGDAMKFAEIVANSDMVPKTHFRKPGNVLVCMQIASSFNVPLLTTLQNVAVINGKPSIYGDMALALVRRRPDCLSVNESFDDKSMTATCEVVRQGQDDPVVRSFSLEDAKTAGLWGKSGPWTQYPKRMLQMRARGFALRDAFPDALMGLITREEAMDYPAQDRRTVRAEVVRSDPSEPEPSTRVADRFDGEVVDGETEKPVDPKAKVLAKRARELAAKADIKLPQIIHDVCGFTPSRDNPPTVDDLRKVIAELELLTGDETADAKDFDTVPF